MSSDSQAVDKPEMVTIITATGSPILISLAHNVRLQDGQLVCLDATGRRLLSFDALDVAAFAVEAPGVEPEWVMGGPGLLSAAREPPPGNGTIWRLPARLRFTYR